MAKSVLSPRHQAQLHSLREWARKQGKTPRVVLKAQEPRLSADEIEARDAATRERLTAVLGPPISKQGA